MSMVGFPLLLIPLAIYNIIVFLMPGVGFTEPLLQVRLVSGEFWAVSLGDMLVTLSVLLLLLEVIKARRGKYLTDHLLSLLVFGAAGAEFVMWPKFANSTFFLLALLAMVEFFAGIALRARRSASPRAVIAAPAPEPVNELPPPAAAESKAAPQPEPRPAAAEPAQVSEHAPRSEPAAVPPAASMAESVLLDDPAPQPAPAAAEASKAEPSPAGPSAKVDTAELQPTTATPAPHQSDTPKP
jgi:hypothetical protein